MANRDMKIIDKLEIASKIYLASDRNIPKSIKKHLAAY